MPAPRLVPDTPAALFRTGDPADNATAPSELRRVGVPGSPLHGRGTAAALQHSDHDSDDEATTLLRDIRLLGITDSDEEETMVATEGVPRHMPGIDDLRAALAEDEESSADPPSHDDFVDDIIEQARAIERAADRRRRSLFRK